MKSNEVYHLIEVTSANVNKSHKMVQGLKLPKDLYRTNLTKRSICWHVPLIALSCLVTLRWDNNKQSAV